MSSRAYHYVAVDHCPKWIEQRVAPYVFWIKGNEDDFRLRKITSIFVFLFIAIALCAVFLTIVAIALCIHKAGGILAVDNKTIGGLLVFVVIFALIAALYRLYVSKSIMKENALYSPLVLLVSLFDVYFVQEDDSGVATFMMPSGKLLRSFHLMVRSAKRSILLLLVHLASATMFILVIILTISSMSGKLTVRLNLPTVILANHLLKVTILIMLVTLIQLL